ncbi:hypothetical protein [Sphingobium mellinum]|uniref:hypothetical protein n=1 Tax=Sphingobium mellinum TaxID=1387166 RepID=UPI0030EE2AA2
MTQQESYAQAVVDAERKKAAFRSSVAAAKARIAPARLKQDIKQKATAGLKNGGAQLAASVNERPIAYGAAGAALLLYLFRRPVSALFRRAYVRIRNRTPEISENDDG